VCLILEKSGVIVPFWSLFSLKMSGGDDNLFLFVNPVGWPFKGLRDGSVFQFGPKRKDFVRDHSGIRGVVRITQE
jgi:hypothetical protein